MNSESKRTTANLAAEHQKIPKFKLKHYFLHHIQACISSFGAMSRTPLASMMTLAVIGIALALPFGLFVILDNVQLLTNSWGNSAQISLYMKRDLSPEQTEHVLQKIKTRSDISKLRYISPEQGLKEFESYSGFHHILAEFEENPLPGVIEVQPSSSIHSTLAIQQLLHNLREYPEVDIAKFDLAWVQRFYSMIGLGRQLVIGLTVLLAFGVILIIGNTIRLNTQSHRAEIEVIKLVGATDGFIRRPFLYSGILYGAMGAIIALVLIESFISWLKAPVQQLARLYHSHFHLHSLDNHGMLLLIATGAVAGLLGSWLAVGKHLRDVEPS